MPGDFTCESAPRCSFYSAECTQVLSWTTTCTLGASLHQEFVKLQQWPALGRAERTWLADGVGFEPTVGWSPTPVFKTGALNRSATHPLREPPPIFNEAASSQRQRRILTLLAGARAGGFHERRATGGSPAVDD